MTGSEKIPNKLVNEKSPYLLQHAYNPVHWFPWGEEAFEKAKAEDKPVFLSIGYSTCHWCHVMAHESFENEQTAAYLNEHFVCIKVDKEERPDIDGVYMRACQAFTGSGGWPLSIFMTAEQKPFFAGTYFPPDTGLYGMSFPSLLAGVVKVWGQDRKALLNDAENITKLLRQNQEDRGAGQGKGRSDANLAIEAATQLGRRFDKKYGGFSRAPKFPMPHDLLFLMAYESVTGEPHALQMAEFTLRKMFEGGIFDHIGYGFSRYSTDETWLAPHFEKMLYDNALLCLAYLAAFERTKKPFYAEVVRRILIYISREMQSPEGGFYAAQDADAEGVEGEYYLFSAQEAISVLGEQDGAFFNRYYHVTPGGNFEGKNILNRQCEGLIDAPEIGPLREKMYAYRKNRMRLHTDDKILTSWNAMMIAAYAKAYRVLGDTRYLECAKKADGFILRHLSDGDRLLSSYKDGKKGAPGFLDDYAYMIWALLELYRATLEQQYLKRARAYLQTAREEFWDNENGGFYFSGKGGESLIARPKEIYDGAIPSGNSVMAYGMAMLELLQDGWEQGDVTDAQFCYMTKAAGGSAENHCFFLYALLKRMYPPKKVVCVLKDETDFDKLQGRYLGDTVLKVLRQPNDAYPLLQDKTTFYVCRGHECLPPTNFWESILGN